MCIFYYILYYYTRAHTPMSTPLSISTSTDNYLSQVRFPNKSPKKKMFDLTNLQIDKFTDRCVPASSMKFDPNALSNTPPNQFMENLTQRMNCYYSTTISE